MRILAIGDPHGNLEKIKKISFKGIDIILVTGDVGKADVARKFYFQNLKLKKEGLEELEYDVKTMKKVYAEICNSSLDVWKYLSKIAQTYSILGNVGIRMVLDSNVKKDEKKYRTKFPSMRKGMKEIKGFHFVRNRVRNVGGLRIGFLEYFEDVCWYKEFEDKSKEKIKKAKKEKEKVKKILKNFKSLDILICHQPPYGYLDTVSSKYNPPEHWIGKHAGSKVILEYIKKHKPKYVFCGHIHEGEGNIKIGKSIVYNLGVAGHKIIKL